MLVDEYGKERATISCVGGQGGKGGNTTIRINDDDGIPRLELLVDSDGDPSIRLSTPGSSLDVSIAATAGGGNGLLVGDSQGKPCISIGVPHPDSDDPRGPHPDITLLDDSAHRGWSAFGGEYRLHEHEN